MRWLRRLGRVSARNGCIALVILLTVGAAVLVARRVQRDRDAARLARIFAGRELPHLQLELSAAAQAALARAPREFVPAEIVLDGRRQSLGVRLKGHRSMRPLSEKPAFKLDFARFDAGQTFLGARRLLLNNLVEDPTSLREALAYRFHTALGVASPRTGFTQLSVNREPHGVYLLVEAVDAHFLRDRFEGDTGVLYEGEYGCDLLEEDVPGFEHDAGKDPERALLREFTQSASRDPRELFDALSGPLNMPLFLRYLAASAIIGDFDGYRHSHNYRIHRDARDGKWQFLPWGLDRVLHRRLAVFDSHGLLAERCFADPSCRVEYVRTLREAVGVFEGARLSQTAHELDALIAAAPDPRATHDAKARSTAKDALLRFIEQRPEEVRRQLTCLDATGQELDRDGDGYGCMDCDDRDPSIRPGAAEVCDGVDNDCSGLVDDDPACDCHDVESGDVEYQLCNLPMPWVEAEAYCAAKGLTLARVPDKKTSQKLYREARRLRRDSWWIGYSDRALEGTFTWTDGSPDAFTYWRKGQPNDQSCREDCAAIDHDQRGRWHDTSCGQHRPVICAPTSVLAASDE